MTKRDVMMVALLLAACGDDSVSTGGAGGVASGGGGGADGGGGGGPDQGGAGGTAPAGCSPYDDPPTCDGGMHCVVIDESLGLNGGTACIAPGTTPEFALCDDDADCVAGSLCDRVLDVCKPVCQLDSDCLEENAVCAQAVTSAGLPIPGLQLCLAACEPIAATVCNDATGPVNCVFNPEEEGFDCAPAGDGTESTPCETHLDCEAGFGCLKESGNSACYRWCLNPAGQFCTDTEHPEPGFAICVTQAPTISAGNQDYGACFPVGGP
jgi:hypothetical protein